MRFRTLEIRWHDSKPISTCDFQPQPFKKARPAVGHEEKYAEHSYRLATGGEDNHVRVWMVYPNIRPTTLVQDESTPSVPRPARVEYLATLSRHSAAVNVVRFSPNGELIASAGDDGMIIIWSPSNTPQQSTYGSDLSPEELQLEKEYWKPRTTFRCTTMQVYDLAWSPTGEYIIAGSTDNTARVFSVVDGKCVQEIAEHTHYVQGVAWDPLNEYIATQSSDRSMHIYSISTKNGIFEAHAVGKNTRMTHRHSRTPSVHGTRPRMFRSQSSVSDAESVTSEYNGKEDALGLKDNAPPTPATSVASGSSSMFPPPSVERSSSRRSSFSSNAPGSPSIHGGRYRSPSPMPPLPAIRSQPTPTWSTIKLYGDESFTNFFRRLTFSPDGGLLMTPAGQFEDQTVVPGSTSKNGNGNGNGNGKEESVTPSRGRKGKPSVTTDLPIAGSQSSSSSVYIYSRANFARTPVAQLPGHKKASVAVRFSPILYELRPGVEGPQTPSLESKGNNGTAAAIEKGPETAMDVDVTGPVASGGNPGLSSLMSPQRTPSHHGHSNSQSSSIIAPSPNLAPGVSAGPNSALFSPALSPLDLRPPTPATSKPPSPGPAQTPTKVVGGVATPAATPNASANNSGPVATPSSGSVFALAYRMLFAVVTMDTVAIYDTQQTGPVCLLTKLHYDEFTDVTWSPDGQCLVLSSRDGYCTLITFDEIIPSHHTQQQALQLQSIAQHHAVPIAYSTTAGAPPHQHPTTITPLATPLASTIQLPTPNPKKRSEPPQTPSSAETGDASGTTPSRPSSSVAASESSTGAKEVQEAKEKTQEPPKKKRRVALTKIAELDP